MKYPKKDKYRSIVDEYNSNCNSFDKYLNDYDSSYLYPHILNCDFEEDIPFPVSQNNKMKFKHDCLMTDFHVLESEKFSDMELPSSFLHMFMSGNNPFYYSYKGEDDDLLIRVYSPLGVKIIIDFVNSCPEFNITIDSEDLQGFIDIVSSHAIGRRTKYRSASKKFYFANIILTKNSVEKPLHFLKLDVETAPASLYSTLKVKNLRLFILALIRFLLKAVGDNTEVLSLQDYSNILTDKSLFDKFLSDIEAHYNSFSDEYKNACTFFSSKYNYIYNKIRTNDYLDAKMCALANQVTHHFDYEILNFPLFKQYHWRNKVFDKFVISTIESLCQIKDKSRWYNHNGTMRMQFLKSLLFLNWCYIPNKVAKSATAIWLFYILSKNLKSAFNRDKQFYKTLLCYVLQQNKLTFLQIIDAINVPYSKDSESIYISCLSHLSDGFKFSIANYTYNQKKLLSRNVKKSLDWGSLLKKYNDFVSKEFLILGEKWVSKIFSFIATMLEAEDYTNQKVIDLVDNMPDYTIPHPYSRNRVVYNQTPSYGPNYEGSYVRDTLGWSKEQIDTILDGDPDAYWNID